jgi:two-component system, NtrC family, response regulator HydG
MSDRKLKILIVDDDVDNAESLSELFQLYGYDTSLVHSGEDAITAYMNSNFDVAFMDVMMPGKNGVESFLEIRKMKPTAKVIMMTGYSVEQLLQQAMDNGAIGVLSKPMDPNLALNMLNEVGPKGMVIARSDGIATRDRLHSALHGAGKSCAVVRSHSEIQSLQNTAKDVIIIDIHRPLIEGVGCFTELQRNGLKAPAIILTDTGTETPAGDSFLNDYRITGILNKPFDPHLLVTSVSQLAA